MRTPCFILLLFYFYFSFIAVVRAALTCGDIFDTDFVAHFMENTTVKKIENWTTFVKDQRIYLFYVFISL